jgi:V8-like Glu-specific endopeptidase
VTAIFGGTPVAAGAWPGVVGLAERDDRTGAWHLVCTGTLVSPTVVVTAGHCLDGAHADALRVYTGDGIEGGLVSADIEVASLHTQPLLRAHPLGYADVGAVVLAAPLAGIEPVPMALTLAETRALIDAPTLAPGVAGTALHLVGYGRREDDGHGVKSEVDARIERGTAHELVAGGDGRDACSGDSGAPAFVRAADGGWRLAAIVSRGLEIDCGPGSYLAVVADAACWLQRETGLAVADPEGRCAGSVPDYPETELATLDVRRACERRTDLAPTQRETLDALLLAVGTDDCATAAKILDTARELDLDGYMLRDVSLLATLPHLETLSLRGNRIAKIAPLARLRTLMTLRIDGNDVLDIDALAPLEAHGTVIYGKRRQLWNHLATDFLGICRAAAPAPAAARTVAALLWSLDTEDCDQANRRLLGLGNLRLAHRDLTDVSPLAGLGRLETLDLSGNPLADAAPLATLEGLRVLDLTGTGIDAAGLAPLAGRIAQGLQVVGVAPHRAANAP